jgi:hypothetical protein
MIKNAMGTHVLKFSNIIETIYGLPLEDRLEIKNLLEHNIADTRRNEISDNFKKAQEEFKSGKLKFSSRISELKEML